LKRRYSTLVFSFIILCLAALPLRAQVQFYRYYESPQGNYTYKNFGNQSFSVPGGQYYYYNGSGEQMEEMMRQLDSMMKQFFSQSYHNYDNFDSQTFGFNMSPGMPEMRGLYGIPGSKNNQNQYVPVVPDIDQAPGYNEAPDLYY
jgi:hypothetical protein